MTIVLREQNVALSKSDMEVILRRGAHFSGSDLKVLCKEAAMGPVSGGSGNEG